MPRMDLEPLRAGSPALRGHGPLRAAVHHRPRDPGLLSRAPTSSCSRTARSSSRASSTRRSPSASRSSPATSAASPRSQRRRGAAAGPRRATPARSPRRSPSCSPTAAPRDELARRRRAAAAGPVLVGRDRRAHARPLPRACVADIRRDDRGRDRLLGRASGCSSTPTSATRSLLALLGRGPTRRRPARDPRRAADRSSLIVAAHDEEEVIAAKVANALALDYPRERLELIVASDGSDRPHRRARPRGRRRPRPRPRARRQGRGPERRRRRAPRGELLAFSDANAIWAPDALRELVAPFADPRVGYVCGQARFVDPGGSNQEGAYWRYEMAVRAARVARSAGSPPATARSTPCAATRTCRSARPRATTSRSRSCSPSAAGAPSTRRGRSPRRRWSATIEGEFARKRRMMRGHLGRGGRRRDALAARLRARSTRSRSPATACCATRRRSSTWSRWRPTSRCSARRRSTWSRSPSRLALLAAAALAGAIPLRAVAARPLLRPRRPPRSPPGSGTGSRLGTPGAWEKAEGTR